MSKLHAVFGGLFLAAAVGSSAQAGLVSYWPFDTSASGVTPDVAGSNAGTLFGNAQIGTDGTRGQVLLLDGTGDFVDAGAQGSLDFGASDFTLAGWVKTTSTSRASLMYFVDPIAPNAGYQIELHANASILSRVLVDNGPASVGPTGPAVSDGSWHHFAAVIKGLGQPSGTATWYIDGVAQPAGDISGLTGSLSPPLTPAQHFTMGGRYLDNTFDPGTALRFLSGSLDDFAAWNVALPAAAITGLANGTYTPQTAPVPEPSGIILVSLGLLAGVAHWRWSLSNSCS